MQALALSYGAKVNLIKSYFDANLIKGLHPVKNAGNVKIAYPTGRIDDPRLERMFFDALKHILEHYKGRVEIHFWRRSVPEQLEGCPGVVLNAAMNSYEAFVKSFYLMGFDIGLAPLVDEPFFRSKSNNKYREFGGCGIAGVYSKMEPYSDCVVSGQNGLLVENTTEAWIDGISELIQNAGLRDTLAKNAMADVKANYTFENAVHELDDTLAKLSAIPANRTDWIYPERMNLLGAYVVSSKKRGFEKDDTSSSERQNAFSTSILTLGGNYMPPLSHLDILLQYPVATTCNVVVYEVDSIADLKAIGASLGLCRSVILDLSRLESEFSRFLELFEKTAVHCPLSLVLNSSQVEFIEFAKNRKFAFAIVDREVTTEGEAFSLKGYRGSMLDLLEKHRRYGKVYRQTSIQKLVQTIRGKISITSERHFGRIRRAWLLFKWRIGRRPV